MIRVSLAYIRVKARPCVVSIQVESAPEIESREACFDIGSVGRRGTKAIETHIMIFVSIETSSVAAVIDRRYKPD